LPAVDQKGKGAMKNLIAVTSLMAAMIASAWGQVVQQCTTAGSTTTCVYGRLAPSRAYRECAKQWSFTPLCAFAGGYWAAKDCHNRWIEKHCAGL
jgi:hypothetical protein